MKYILNIIKTYFESLFWFRTVKFKNFIHNLFIHPICACLPEPYSERLHRWHVDTIYIKHWSLDRHLNNDHHILFDKTREELIAFLNADILFKFGSAYQLNDEVHSAEITEFIDWLYEFVDNETQFTFEGDHYDEEFRNWVKTHHKEIKLANC